MLGWGACGGGGSAATLIARESQPAAPRKTAEAPSGTLSSEPSMSRPKTTLSTWFGFGFGFGLGLGLG